MLTCHGLNCQEKNPCAEFSWKNIKYFFIFQHCSGAVQQQAIIWTNYGLIYWRIYVSLGLDGLKVELT